MSSTIEQLQKLADQLTTVAPPPSIPKGLNFAVPDSGRWVVVKAGSGMFAVRPEYEDKRGGSITATTNGEIRGFAPAIETALMFALSIHTASRHYWSEIPSYY